MQVTIVRVQCLQLSGVSYLFAARPLALSSVVPTFISNFDIHHSARSMDYNLKVNFLIVSIFKQAMSLTFVLRCHPSSLTEKVLDATT